MSSKMKAVLVIAALMLATLAGFSGNSKVGQAVRAAASAIWGA
jgi:hypothetical protein